MPESYHRDYSFMDAPDILMRLFHPRPDHGSYEKPERAVDVSIPMDNTILVGGRFHMRNKYGPNILFFHGNGEIAADYDDLGALYTSMGMNFLPIDYRGYGQSTGIPTVSTMMEDCHRIFEFIKNWLDSNGFNGSFIVMGRSLGSACALELANYHKDLIDGLIIESGFAHTGRLLELLGVNISAILFREENGFRNLEKIRIWDKRILIIHAEFDHIIPFSDGQALYNACPSSDKTLLKIPGANHNDIFMRGMDMYMKEIKNLVEYSTV